MEKPKILIVEDDKSLVKMIESALTKDEFDVILAIDANDGIKKASSRTPDIIVLDVMLPIVTGFECLKRLKSKKETKDIPVIILSNLGQAEEIKKGLDLGAADYIVKADFSIDQVVEKILKHLKKVKA